MFSALFRKNDSQHPEIVIATTFFLIFMSFILVVMSFILLNDKEQTTAAAITTILAGMSISGLVLCGYKWGNVKG